MRKGRNTDHEHTEKQREKRKDFTTGGNGESEIQLDLAPQLGSGVFGIELRQFPQKFLGALVAGHGDVDRDLDDLVPADAFSGGRRNAFLPQAEFLTGLRAWRNLQERPAVDGGD